MFWKAQRSLMRTGVFPGCVVKVTTGVCRALRCLSARPKQCRSHCVSCKSKHTPAVSGTSHSVNPHLGQGRPSPSIWTLLSHSVFGLSHSCIGCLQYIRRAVVPHRRQPPPPFTHRTSVCHNPCCSHNVIGRPTDLPFNAKAQRWDYGPCHKLGVSKTACNLAVTAQKCSGRTFLAGF